MRELNFNQTSDINRPSDVICGRRVHLDFSFSQVCQTDKRDRTEIVGAIRVPSFIFTPNQGGKNRHFTLCSQVPVNHRTSSRGGGKGGGGGSDRPTAIFHK